MTATVTVYAIVPITTTVEGEDERTLLREAITQTLTDEHPEAALYTLFLPTGEKTVYLDRDFVDRVKDETDAGSPLLDIATLAVDEKNYQQCLTQNSEQSN